MRADEQPESEEPVHATQALVAYLDAPVPSALVEQLFDAARALFARVPWAVIGDEARLLSIDAPAQALDGAAVSVLGIHGSERGFLLASSLGELEQFLGEDEAPVSTLALTFADEEDLPPAFVEQVKKRALPIGEAYPVLFAIEPEDRTRPLASRDFEQAITVARALAAFVARNEEALLAGALEVPPLELELGELGAVRIGPNPGAPWEELVADPDAELLFAFEDFLLEKKVDDALLETATFVCGFLLQLADEEDGSPLDPELLEEFLLDRAPRTLPLAPEAAPRVVPGLRHFLSFLEEEGVDRDAVELASGLLDEHEAEATKALSDELRFQPGKRAALEARRSLDVDEAPEERELRLQELDDAAFCEKRQPVVRAEPKVGRNEPCPCGSGKKRKKCCG